jgi:NADPH:quinone reductase-like Zn-dependent oxidoreductase
MRAVVCRRSGQPEVLEIAEVERPAVPDDGVLVRVHAASVNPADLFALSGAFHAMRRLSRRAEPEVVGRDFAGTVEAVGGAVTDLRPGDEVFGSRIGAFAEYVCVSEHGAIIRKPARLTFAQAAAVPVAAVTALQTLRDHGRIRPGSQVLVNGASGGVGTFAVQLARALGGEVTGVCSPRNVDQARSLGADPVVDYTREDFRRLGVRFDLLIDIAGSRSFPACRGILAPRATFVAAGASAHTAGGAWRILSHLAGVRLSSLGSRRRAVLFIAKMRRADLLVLRDLLESGAITPIVERTYPLDEVAAAFRHVSDGHARAKVAVDVSGLAGETSSRRASEVER